VDEAAFQPPPKPLEAIMAATRAIGFQIWCWPQVGALLRVMAALKPGGRLLEIGTGTGVSTCWLLDGMDKRPAAHDRHQSQGAGGRPISARNRPQIDHALRGRRRNDPARATKFLRSHLRRWRRRQAYPA
jgi:hypothetical protein